MREVSTIISIFFGLFAFGIAIIITLLIGREILRVERQTPIEEIPQVQLPKEKASVTKRDLLELIKKSLTERKRNYPSHWGWHTIGFLPGEVDDDMIHLCVMYYTDEGQKPSEIFVITYPKHSINIISNLQRPPSILSLGGYGQDYKVPKGIYAVGQKLISAYNIIHTITEISEDEDSEYLRFDVELTEAESEKNYLFISRTDTTVQRFNMEQIDVSSKKD